MKDHNFKFYMPIDLIKGDSSQSDDESDWRIEGVASTEDEDLQGEAVDQNGLDISVLKAGRGVFNWDHKSDPQYVLGEIEDADFIDVNGKKALKVKGYLFKHQENAKSIYGILKSLKKSSKHRVQMSIEGKILQRDPFNSKAIKKARITKVALTLDPVNPYTYADLVKALNNNEEPAQFEVSENKEESVTIKKSDLKAILDFAQKALSAGTGYAGAPGSMTGGSAMTTESLEGKEHNVTYQEKKTKKKNMLKSLIKSLKNAYPNEDTLKLSELVIEAFVDKFED